MRRKVTFNDYLLLFLEENFLRKISQPNVQDTIKII